MARLSERRTPERILSGVASCQDCDWDWYYYQNLDRNGLAWAARNHARRYGHTVNVRTIRKYSYLGQSPVQRDDPATDARLANIDPKEVGL